MGGTSLSYIEDVDLILFGIETLQITRLRVAFARCEVVIGKQPVANEWESGIHLVLHNVVKHWILTFYRCGKKGDDVQEPTEKTIVSRLYTP